MSLSNLCHALVNKLLNWSDSLVLYHLEVTISNYIHKSKIQRSHVIFSLSLLIKEDFKGGKTHNIKAGKMHKNMQKFNKKTLQAFKRWTPIIRQHEVMDQKQHTHTPLKNVYFRCPITSNIIGTKSAAYWRKH